MKYKTVLVEDEENALSLLKTLLEEHREDIEIVAVAQDGPEAVRIIDHLRPDLVFMDVNLPGMNAFEVWEELESPPLLVMTTAHPEHALRAFEISAIGYLVKPFDPDDLAKVIQKVKRVSPLATLVMQDLQAMLKGNKDYPRGIMCKVGARDIIIPNDDILFFQSEFKYTTVVSKSARYVLETPLVELEARLDPSRFLRIHRSSIVNISHITALKHLNDGKTEVYLKDSPIAIRASRSYSLKLKSIWI